MLIGKLDHVTCFSLNLGYRELIGLGNHLFKVNRLIHFIFTNTVLLTLSKLCTKVYIFLSSPIPPLLRRNLEDRGILLRVEIQQW